MAASGRGGGVSIVEGAGGAAEAGRGHHDTDHQALDASDGVGGLRLLACTRAGAATNDEIGRQGELGDEQREGREVGVRLVT